MHSANYLNACEVIGVHPSEGFSVGLAGFTNDKGIDSVDQKSFTKSDHKMFCGKNGGGIPTIFIRHEEELYEYVCNGVTIYGVWGKERPFTPLVEVVARNCDHKILSQVGIITILCPKNRTALIGNGIEFSYRGKTFRVIDEGTRVSYFNKEKDKWIRSRGFQSMISKAGITVIT